MTKKKSCWFRSLIPTRHRRRSTDMTKIYPACIFSMSNLTEFAKLVQFLHSTKVLEYFLEKKKKVLAMKASHFNQWKIIKVGRR